MIRLRESIIVESPLYDSFTYTSNFRHIQDWDPGVISSVQIYSKETGVGSQYDLVLNFGPFRPEMKYEIIEYHPFSKVVLKGKAETFTAIDTIVFTQVATGTQIDYQADIQFHRLGKFMEQSLSPVMKHIGKKAISGLKHKLDGAQSVPNQKRWFKSGASLIDFFADHLIIPGMLMFSRFGYDLSRRFWKEPKGTLYGKRIVLTGGTSGIGKSAAFKLAEQKAFVTIIARDRAKAGHVQKEIVKKTGNPNIDFLIADLSLMQDIRGVVKELKASKKPIDILINNAGALFNERKQTSENIEQTFATDLLGVFLLTMGVKDVLAKSCTSRIINVSSGGMYTQKIDVKDLENNQGEYNGAKAYARAKRGVVILTQVWGEKFKKHGITVNAMHPGWVDTPGIEKSLPKFHQLLKRVLRTPEQGADTIVWLASSKRAGHFTGLFWLDRRPHETHVFPGTGESIGERQLLWKKLNDLISES